MGDNKKMWSDPDSSFSGVLLSDRIAFYVEQVDLIAPFDKNCLKSASYKLHAGNVYYLEDKEYYVDDNAEITIPKNGLIYLQLKEKLNIPYYMIAQHNLRVKESYRGFLAGSSLLVDPGFSGRINYPIYNFTNQDKKIKVNEHITDIIFIKTTQFGNSVQLSAIESLKRLQEEEINGYGGKVCAKKIWEGERRIHEYWRPFKSDTHISSVKEIRDEISTFKDYFEKEKRLAQIFLLGLVGFFITLIVTWGVFFWNHSSHVQWCSDESSKTSKCVDSNTKEVDSCTKEMESIKERMKKIEAGANPKEQKESNSDRQDNQSVPPKEKTNDPPKGK